MTLGELAEQLKVPQRQIRFLISEGILPAASKTGRAADAYDESHLIQGKRYLALYRMGMKPGSIKILMAFDDAVPILQAHGVELRISSNLAPAEIDTDAVLNAVSEAIRAYKGEV